MAMKAEDAMTGGYSYNNQFSAVTNMMGTEQDPNSVSTFQRQMATSKNTSAMNSTAVAGGNKKKRSAQKSRMINDEDEIMANVKQETETEQIVADTEVKK